MNPNSFTRWLIAALVLFITGAACCSTALGGSCSNPVMVLSPSRSSATPPPPTPSITSGVVIEVTVITTMQVTGPAVEHTPPSHPTTDPATSRLPPDVPIYPGATGFEVVPGVTLSFSAPAPLEVVSSFYQQKLSVAGWIETRSLTPSAGGSPELVQYWRKVDMQLDFAYSRLPERTLVTIGMSINP
jgi:hypothetical protein